MVVARFIPDKVRKYSWDLKTNHLKSGNIQNLDHIGDIFKWSGSQRVGLQLQVQLWSGLVEIRTFLSRFQIAFDKMTVYTQMICIRLIILNDSNSFFFSLVIRQSSSEKNNINHYQYAPDSRVGRKLQTVQILAAIQNPNHLVT